MMPTLRAFSILLFSLLALTGCQSLASKDQASVTDKPLLHKAHSDPSSYHLLTLENGLNVILVSDPQAAQFAAAMAVDVGSYQDPKDQQGLAHFLEHMLLLGTKKFPKAGEYQSYISNHGGSYNAYTNINSTNFFFSVPSDSYKGALDRFSQFFIAPTLDPDSAQREKNVVNAEYKAKINSDRRRLNQAFKTLLNPAHPQSKFTVGSLDTLKDRENNPLRQQLLKLYKHNYVANNMSLVLVANLPHSQLKKLAQRYFSDIPSGQVNRVQTKAPLIKAGAPQLQFTRPNIDNNSVSFCYQIDNQNPHYKTRPSRYLAYLIENEKPGSLYALLKDKGLINNLNVSLSPDYQDNALLCANLNLTDHGMQQINTVATHFFGFINTIKSTPINPSYLKEERILNNLNYEYHNYIKPQPMAKLLASKMLAIPLDDILSSFKIEKIASNQEITQLLNQINEKNLLVQIATKQAIPTQWAKSAIQWTLEPWYQSQYSNNQFSAAFKHIVHTDSDTTPVDLPTSNPFIPTSMTLVGEQDATPSLVYQEPDFRFWHKSDAHFKKPTSINFLALCFDHAADSAKHTMLNHLWTRSFNDSIKNATYEPYIAGLGYSFYPHLNGVSFNTTGYSDKQNNYLVWLVDQLLTFQPEQKNFSRIKSQLLKDLENQKNKQVYQVANVALDGLITKNNYTTSQLESALENTSFDDLKSFINMAKSQLEVQGYSTGNTSKSDTIKLATTLHELFKGKLAHHTPAQVETKQLTTKEKLHHRFDSNSNDSTVLYALIDTTPQNLNKSAYESTLQLSYFAILRNILNSRFYNQLRTNQQLGYIVGIQDLSTRNTPILGFLIQSPDKDSKTIIKAIEGFIQQQTRALLELSNSDFNYAKANLLNSLQSSARNLGDNAYSEWHEIAKPKPDFAHKQRALRIARDISKQDFVNYITEKLARQNIAKILIHNKPLDEKLRQDGNWVTAYPEGNILTYKKP